MLHFVVKKPCLFSERLNTFLLRINWDKKRKSLQLFIIHKDKTRQYVVLNSNYSIINLIITSQTKIKKDQIDKKTLRKKL